MGFLVGNDFVPHLPNMHIKQDHLPLIYQSYSKVVADQGDYLTNRGKINLSVFEALLKGNKGFQNFVEFSVIFRELPLFWISIGSFWFYGKQLINRKMMNLSRFFPQQSNLPWKFFFLKMFFWKLWFFKTFEKLSVSLSVKCSKIQWLTLVS